MEIYRILLGCINTRILHIGDAKPLKCVTLIQFLVWMENIPCNFDQNHIHKLVWCVAIEIKLSEYV